MRAALRHNDPYQRRATAQARRARALIDRQMVAVATCLAPDVLMTAKGRAAMFDAQRQHLADSGMQASHFIWGERLRLTQRMNARVKERFICVDIANARDTRLIEQQRLHLAGASGQKAGQRGGRKLLAEWLQPQPSKGARKFCGGIERDAPELARVGEDETAAIIQQEDDAAVGVVDHFPRAMPVGSGNEQEIACHAPMNHQRLLADRRVGRSAGVPTGRSGGLYRWYPHWQG